MTSLVVVRPDEKPTVSSLQKPHQDFGGIPSLHSTFSSFSPGHIATRNRVVGSKLAPRPQVFNVVSLSAPTLQSNSVAYTTTYRPRTTSTYGPPVGAYDAYHYDYDYDYEDDDEEPTPHP